MSDTASLKPKQQFKATLVQGTPGAPGPPGPPGPVTIVVGTVSGEDDLPMPGVLGEAWICADDGHIHSWDGDEYIDGGQFVGPEGQPGHTGPKGPDGAAGPVTTIQGVVSTPSELPLIGTATEAWIVEDLGHLACWTSPLINPLWHPKPLVMPPAAPTGGYWYDAGQIVGPPGAQGVQGDAGPQGTQGSIGPQGPQGIQGQGPAGAQGPQGPQGPAGPTGAEGPGGQAGATGPQGLPGDQGPQGVQGPQGSAGMQGPQGAKGDTGADGIQGPQGDTGAAGTSIEILGSVATAADLPPTGVDGDAWIVADTGHLWVWTDGAWLDAGLIQGPPGVTGAPGPAGPQGAAGVDGATGPQGPRGMQGMIGPQGDPGTVGPQGPAGPGGADGVQGPQGLQGLTGPQGPKGDTGVGAQGPTGAQGPKGDTGPDGAAGQTGPKGDTGPQGVTGTPGAQGVAGPQGPQGATGAQGVVGPQGAQGVQGPQGQQGATGPQGPGPTAIVNGGTAIANTATQGSLFSGGTTAGTLTIPAGAVHVGCALRVQMLGTMGNTTSNGGPTLTVPIQFGSTVIATLSFLAATLKGYTGKFTLDVFVIRATATTCSVTGMIRVAADDSTTAVVQSKFTAGASVDMSSAVTLDIQAKWSAANASCTIKNDMAEVVIRNAV